VSFYLPQFHPVPENDAWWGPGFTEWTNTAKARPLFRGHVQPHLPADLGFYDLRLPEAREAQSDLAQRYGVEAFVYWHYWFGGGRRILERPFAEVLASGAPSVKFCLAWANQTWSGIWHGASDKVLMEQTYPGLDDEIAHFEHLLPAFRDERYLRVDDKPVFYVFRPEELPDAAAFVDRWQAMARAAGLPGLYLVAEVSDLLGAGPRYVDVDAAGFDAGVYMRIPARRTQADILRMRFGRKVLHRPEVYPHATQAVATLTDRPAAERLLWVKSWNEWAEGNHLEPDLEHGHGWLQALHDGLTASSTLATEPARVLTAALGTSAAATASTPTGAARG
jgi:lipopolysaccharide biosynthesis protein